MPINLKTPFINIGSSMSSSSENEKDKKCDSDETETVTAKTSTTTEDPAPTCPITKADQVVEDDSSSAQELLGNEKNISSEEAPEIIEKVVESDDQILMEVLMEDFNSKENEILGNEKFIDEKPHNKKVEIIEKKSTLKPTSPERTFKTDVLSGGILNKLSNIFSFIKNM